MNKKYFLIPLILLSAVLFIPKAHASYGPDTWDWFPNGGANSYIRSSVFLPTSTLMYVQCPVNSAVNTYISLTDNAGQYENADPLTLLGNNWYTFSRGSLGSITAARMESNNSGYNGSGNNNNMCGGSIIFQDFPPLTLNLISPSTTLYNDFSTWQLSALVTTGDQIETDVQYDTADDLSTSGNVPSDLTYCGQSPGAIDTRVQTAATSSLLFNLPKRTAITPYVNNFTNPVANNGFQTKITLKLCIDDLTQSTQSVATTSLIMEYGGSPLSGGSTSTSMTFLYPSSTSYVYPPFESILMHITGVVSSTLYTLTVRDYADGTPILINQHTDFGSDILQNTGMTGSNDYYNFNFGNATSVPITFNVQLSDRNGLDAFASTTFKMIPYEIITSTGTINPNGVAGVVSPGFEFINGVATGNSTTSNFNGGLPTSILPTLATVNCPTPAGVSDIGGGFYWAACSIIQAAFYPGPGSEKNLENSILGMEKVPPFVYFFQVNNAVTAEVNTNQTTKGVSMVVVDKMNGGTSTIIVVPGDLTANAYLAAQYQGYGINAVNLWFNLALDGCILLIIIMMYRLVF